MPTLEEMFEQWVKADLEAKKAQAEAAKPQYVTKEDLASFSAEVAKAFAEQIEAVKTSFTEQFDAAKAEMAEQVEKALPVRPQGGGRIGGESPSDEGGDEDPVSYLAAKARTEDGWDAKDKELVTAIVVGAALQGMKPAGK